MLNIKKIIKKGGTTINLNGQNKHKSPKKGYMVSIQGKEQTYKINEPMWFLQARLLTYIGKHAGLLASKNIYLGLWVDDGVIYFDLSMRIKDKDEAISMGKRHQQLAIWDIKKQKVINIS